MYVLPSQPRRGFLILSVLFGLAAPAARAPGAAPARSADPAAPSRPAPLILEDPPQPLTPKRPRTELQQERLQALSLFAAARTHQRQQQYARALRLYQRALRHDPEAVAVARAIPPLALRLNRLAEAVRYALILAEMEPVDPLLFWRLGNQRTQVRDYRAAIKFYEKAMAARAGVKQTAFDITLRREAGPLYYLIEKYDHAADCFARVSYALDHPKEFGLNERSQKVLLGEPGVTYNLFGEAFLLADRIDEAAAAFEKAHRLAPNQGLLQFNHARIHARKGNPQKALAALEACFKEHLASEAVAPFELLATVLDELGKKAELIQRLEKLRTEDPKNVLLGYFLAEQYHQAEKFDKAEPLYRALIQTDPTPTGYRRLAEIYRKTGRPDALLVVLGEVVEKTGLLETLGPQAQAVSTDAQLMQSVVETARKQHQSEPKELNYHVRLAVALLALQAKQLDSAAEFFDLALKAKPDQAVEVFLDWGLRLLLAERPAEAAEVFQRGIDRQVPPEADPRLYNLLAGALAMDDQAEKALAAARKAAELARVAAGKAGKEALAAKEALPAAQGGAEERRAMQKAVIAAANATKKKEDLARFSSRVGWVLYRSKRNDEAIQVYRRLLAEFDSAHESPKIRDLLREARLVLSGLYVLKEDLAQAEEWLQQVLDEFPDDVGASNDLGYLWADQGKYLNRALKMIQRAVHAEPENAAYRDSLGWVFYRLGRHTEAVAELQKAAAAENEPDPVILDHLGDAHLKAKQPQKAKQAWRQAVKAFQKREEPQKAEQVQQKMSEIQHVP